MFGCRPGVKELDARLESTFFLMTCTVLLSIQPTLYRSLWGLITFYKQVDVSRLEYMGSKNMHDLE